MTEEQRQKEFEEMMAELYYDRSELIAAQPEPENHPNAKQYDYVNPNHYKDFFGAEAIDMFEKLSSKEEFVGYLKLTYLKYATRLFAGKPGEDEQRTLEKMRWFWNKYQEIKNKH